MNNDGIYIGFFTQDERTVYSVAWVIGNDLELYRCLGGEELEGYVNSVWRDNGVFFSDLKSARAYAASLDGEYQTKHGVKEVGNLSLSYAL